MQNTVLIVHVVIGLLFVLSVLVQDKGSGLSATFGGSGGFYASQRGAAKVIHYFSVIFCLVFFATALLYVVVEEDAPVGPESSSIEGAPLELQDIQLE
jgi:protein translocase SecG subunit